MLLHQHTRNKQEELKALAQSQSYYIIGVSKTWWEEPCGWCAVMGGYRLFRKDRQGTKKAVGMAESCRSSASVWAVLVDTGLIFGCSSVEPGV